MGGLIIVFVLCVWILLANVIAKFFLSRIKLEAGIKKRLAHIGFFVLVFIAPVADEIIGGFQFRAMCTPENMLAYDAEKIRGKSIKYKGGTVDKIDNILPIWVTQSEFVDPGTGQVLIVRRKFDADGGWLSRLISYPDGPYTFRGTCNAFKAYDKLVKELNITVIEN